MTGKPDDPQLDEAMLFLRTLEEAAAGDLELPPPRAPTPPLPLAGTGSAGDFELAGPLQAYAPGPGTGSAAVEMRREHPEPFTHPVQQSGRFWQFGLGLVAVAACLSGLVFWWIEDKLHVPAAVNAPAVKASSAANRASASNTGSPSSGVSETTPVLRVAQAVQASQPPASLAETPRTVPAEEPARATLVLPAALTLDAGGTKALPFTIEPAILARGSGALLVRGLPQGVSLSHGSADAIKGWRVPLAESSRLAVVATGQASGRHEVTIEFRSREDVLLAVARFTLVIALATSAEPMSGPMRASEAATRQWLGEGRRLISQGHVAAARLLLQRAADNGLGEAALELGDTYDPAKLYALGVRGMSGDVSMAILWYERADELGESLAKSRLIGIGTP